MSVITKAVVEQMIAFHRDQLNRFKSIATGCTDCVHVDRRFDTHKSAPRHCNLHNADIPNDFLDKGCDQWVYDEIPF